MKRASRNEQNMISSYHAITTVHCRAFDNRQDVALHSFARNVRPVSRFSTGDFVDLIEENDARVLDPLDCSARNLIHVNESLFLFLHHVFDGFINTHLAPLCSTLKEIAQHVLHVDAHLFHTLRTSQLDYWKVFLSNFEFNQAVVQFSTS